MVREIDDILDALAAGLATAERRLAEEQAVHGLDSLDEVAIHPLLADGLAAGGWSVFRESPYPGQPEVLPKESERLRCDLVIAPAGTVAIADQVRQQKEIRAAQGTLFVGVADRLTEPPAGAVPPEEACWLEVKTNGQYTYVDGVAGPNRSYSSQFNTCLTDVRKLAKAEHIEHARVAVVTFAEAAEVAEQDLMSLVHKCLDRNLPVADFRSRSLPIINRVGNEVCTVGLIRVRTER